MEQLSQILTQATAAIGAEYFRLPIEGGNPVYRERVYCYELYHQMRLRWPGVDLSAYRLNAEVDKRAHHALEQLGVHGQKPDFLVHQPGHMAGNHAIIEVKHAPSNSEDIRKDLRSLALFRHDVGYDRAIYLVYGHRADASMVARVVRYAAGVDGANSIEIWLHQEAGAAAAYSLTL
jgi:hypothetical protein